MGPLAGLRVVELTTAWAGPMAGRILAFLGAEVIHVESASRLDSWRQHRQVFSAYRYPRDGLGERPWNRVALFNAQNVNKLSLSVDLKKPGGKDVLLGLLARSDVLLCNFTPGTLARLGLSRDHLVPLRPDIIVVEMPAFGLAGPMAHGPAIGPTMEMAAGMANMIGYPDGPPMTTGPTYPDPIGAFHGAAAVLTALLHRRRGGPGQHVEVPQVEAAMHYIGDHILHAVATGEDPPRFGNLLPWAVPHGIFPAAGDDQWIAVAAPDDAAFAALSRVMGRPDLAAHADLRGRLANRAAIEDAVAAWTSRQDKHAAAEALQAAGVPAAPVNDAAEAFASPYLAFRGHFTDLDHPEVGRTAHEGLPFRLSDTPGAQYRAAPCLGQHNHAILREVLGLTDAEIARLEQAGTISADPE
jgi:crotonobetainyl-CoA:carnitine CoA-transferase CaiB-like acyl-CoA transferase